MIPRIVCQHCRKLRTKRPRGLCWECHANRGIRALYPPEPNKFTQTGNGIGGKGRPPEPTAELPVTEGKLQVLEQRAERGEALFNEQDAKRELE